MQTIPEQALAQQLGVKPPTIQTLIRTAGFPKPVRLGGPKSRVKVWVRAEVDAWLASRVAARDAEPEQPTADGRRKYWDDVRAGRRLHPRTAARLKREAAERQEVAAA